IRDEVAARERGLHALMPHGDAVRYRNGAEFARRAAALRNALLHRLRLTHERDVAGSGLVPAGRDANEGLRDFLFAEAHRVIVGTMRRALWPDRNMTAGQFRLVECLCVHALTPAGQAAPAGR